MIKLLVCLFVIYLLYRVARSMQSGDSQDRTSDDRPGSVIEGEIVDDEDNNSGDER